MNIRMAINSQLSTIESKKLSKQTEQKQNHREIIWRVINWEGEWGG